MTMSLSMTEPNCSTPLPGPTASAPIPVDEDQQVAAYYIWQENGSQPDDPNTALWWLEGGFQLELLALEATGTESELGLIEGGVK